MSHSTCLLIVPIAIIFLCIPCLFSFLPPDVVIVIFAVYSISVGVISLLLAIGGARNCDYLGLDDYRFGAVMIILGIGVLLAWHFGRDILEPILEARFPSRK